jgi:hypothetical protein
MLDIDIRGRLTKGMGRDSLLLKRFLNIVRLPSIELRFI